VPAQAGIPRDLDPIVVRNVGKEFLKPARDSATLKDQVSALEIDVQGTPNNRQVLADTDALVKHLGMMSKMHGGGQAAKKKMDMKKM